MSPQVEREYRAGLAAALEAGYAVLARGGPSLDAVAAAVVVMEDSPLFNAGRGAAFTAEGKNELDAAIMDGVTLRAGAVTLVTTVKNPILLARLVMENTRHVMLSAHGAEALAREHGLETVAPEYFYTERRWQALQRVRKAQVAGDDARITEGEKHGTVGAVALDRHGNLAAATSTGGYTNKMAGRVGDTPIIGAGTYASNATAAVSCTGQGEYFMRAVAAHSVSMLMELKGWSVKQAAEHVLRNQLVPLGGGGGLIAVDRAGHIARCLSGAGMYYAHRKEGSPPVVAIYAEAEA
jgi:beta-aspartyl-peptidase (threonine type)